MSALQLTALTRDDPSFYPLIGPFLARRDIAREMGGPLWDDDGKQWLAAVLSGRAAGICAWVEKPSHVAFCSAYVLPEWRGKGVYAALFDERLALTQGRLCRATCTRASYGTFMRHGFIDVGARGQYRLMERKT